MRALFLFVLTLGLTLADHHHHEDEGDLRDYDRACLDGFFYAGEPREDMPVEDKDWLADEGERTPVYSCYSIIQVGEDEDPMSLSQATLRCNDMRGQLLSVNDTLEEFILTSQNFLKRIDKQDAQYLTSAIKLGPKDWIWMGADQPVDEDTVGELDMKDNDNYTQCMTISWTKNENGSSVLTYKAAPCMDKHNYAICEARVYTQTWYVWFGANWLQVLFFFTLAVLIFTCCCMMQAWFWKSSRSAPVAPVPYRPRSHLSDLPPSYNEINRSADRSGRSAAGRYAEKGREILAKVIYFRPNSGNPEKPPLPH